MELTGDTMLAIIAYAYHQCNGCELTYLHYMSLSTHLVDDVHLKGDMLVRSGFFEDFPDYNYFKLTKAGITFLEKHTAIEVLTAVLNKTYIRTVRFIKKLFDALILEELPQFLTHDDVVVRYIVSCRVEELKF